MERIGAMKLAQGDIAIGAMKNEIIVKALAEGIGVVLWCRNTTHKCANNLLLRVG